MEWFQLYSKTIKSYLVFSGRASRKEFWTFYLVNLIIQGIFYVWAYTSSSSALLGDGVVIIPSLLLILWSLAIFPPALGVAIRRMHDINRNGWNLLWICLPIVGWIIILVFYFSEGTQGDNNYGQKPDDDVNDQSNSLRNNKSENMNLNQRNLNKFIGKNYKDILTESGLSEYCELFEKNKLTDLQIIFELSDNDLKEIGITAMGDRKRILAAFQ